MVSVVLELVLVARGKWKGLLSSDICVCGPADLHSLMALPEGCSLGWEGAVATATKVLAMGRVIPAEGKACLKVACMWSLEWMICFCKWPHFLKLLVALLVDKVSAVETSPCQVC